MDVGQIAAFVGTGVGSAVAAYFTAIYAVGKPVRARVDEVESNSLKKTALDELEQQLQEKIAEVDKRAQALEERASVLEEKHTNLHNRQQTSDQRIDQMQGRMITLVSTEEFQTHAGYMNTNLNNLTDKVGRAIGALEAWRDRGR